MLIALRLKYVGEADFRMNEESQARVYSKILADLNANEVICLFSKTGKMMRFIWKPQSFNGLNEVGIRRKGIYGVIQSMMHRITDGGTWNPLMIRNYANEIGLDLTGLKRMEDHYGFKTNHGRRNEPE
jgi:hypothetical protein